MGGSEIFFTIRLATLTVKLCDTLFASWRPPCSLYLVRAGLAGGAAAVEVALVGHELLGLVDGAAAPGAACRVEGERKIMTTIDS